VIGAQDALPVREQLLQEAQGFLPVPRLSGPGGDIVAGGERVGVIGTQDALPVREQLLREAQGFLPVPVCPVQKATLLRVASVLG